MGERISSITRFRIRVTGIVQGVGFRPFIYRLAIDYDLSGFVLNDSEGVLIEVQGAKAVLQSFCKQIKSSAPPASKVNEVRFKEIAFVAGEEAFVIKQSSKAVECEAMISPDLAICDDCKKEIADRNNRRYNYAFTNCTNCGPRFSIVQDIPYDRKYTTMKDFLMCDSCQSEYDNPLDRRFHAQPNACSDCGPVYRLFGEAEIIADDVISKARKEIKKGAIIAVKGIGGYHLACDAFNEEAVAKLRKRKLREDKPFAVMAKNLATVKKLCFVNDKEEHLLQSAMAPIVLLQKAKTYNLALAVAPENLYLGVMLAYAPIHYLLLQDDDVFVMTSANLSDEPIVYKDEEVDKQLKEIADYKLIHNRLINIRVDDSVARVFRDRPQILRRSRGFAPAPLDITSLGEKDVSILACGAELKSTFCLTKHNRAFISQHIGDLENMAVYNSYKESLALFERLFDIKPNVVACDMHPDYFSTKYAKSLNLPLIKVQHHHAHIASVLAEHHLNQDVIGVALDGTGYGEDGCIWGGEFMLANLNDYKRVGHFAYTPLPSGAKAVKEPWRLSLWQVYLAHGEDFKNLYPELLKDNWQLLLKATENRLNAPLSSSAGRVFDTVAGMLGICHIINYEGQAAIELEKIASFSDEKGELLPYEIRTEAGQYILDFKSLYKSLARLKLKYSISYIAKSFHLTVAKTIGEIVRRIGVDTGLKKVAFSGGVCQNIMLLDLLHRELETDFEVYINEKVPPNDGGIALGQASIALARMKKYKI